jgi:hypothetical protein
MYRTQVLVNAVTGEVKRYFKWTVTRLIGTWLLRLLLELTWKYDSPKQNCGS